MIEPPAKSHDDTATSSAITGCAQLFVVIDHHQAKIYSKERLEPLPQQIVYYDPHGFGEHLPSRILDTDGKPRPEQKTFFESVATALAGAEQILIFGHYTGKSSAMDLLFADLKRNHSEVVKHIVGTVVIDQHHQTENQLLAQARTLFVSMGV